MIRTA